MNLKNIVLQKTLADKESELVVSLDTSSKLQSSLDDKCFEIIKVTKDMKFKKNKLQSMLDEKNAAYALKVEQNLKQVNIISQLKQELLKKLELSENEHVKEMKQSEDAINVNKNTNTNVKGGGGSAKPVSTVAKKKKRNFRNLNEQIQILNSDALRMRSFNLCSMKTDTVGTLVQFLIKYLKSKVIEQMWKKLDKNGTGTTDAQGLHELLSFTVILFKVKEHQVKTGTKDRPKLNNREIKEDITHLTAWITRTYGEPDNTGNKTAVHCVMDNGEQFNGQYVKYTFEMSKKQSKNDLAQWVEMYVVKGGKHSDSKL